jgi:hypothetical protein
LIRTLAVPSVVKFMSARSRPTSSDPSASRHAIQAYLDQHPALSAEAARHAVARLIADATTAGRRG